MIEDSFFFDKVRRDVKYDRYQVFDDFFWRKHLNDMRHRGGKICGIQNRDLTTSLKLWIEIVPWRIKVIELFWSIIEHRRKSWNFLKGDIRDARPYSHIIRSEADLFASLDSTHNTWKCHRYAPHGRFFSTKLGNSWEKIDSKSCDIDVPIIESIFEKIIILNDLFECFFDAFCHTCQYNIYFVRKFKQLW